MYFVYDNQAFMHTSTPVLMTMGEHLNEWQHITLTWAGGDPARAAIYLNGEHVASTFKTTDVTRQPRTRLFVGSDRAAEMAGERPSDCLFDELVIYGRVLTDSEIAAAYRGQESRWAEIQGRKWAWLTDTLAGPDPTFERDENGLVLESRALLDEGHPWSDPTNIPVIIDRMKRAGFNVYIPCVWHGRGTRYPGPTADPGLQDAYAALATDPLEELVTQCHAEGIEVHPWFCVGKRENDLHPEFVEDGTPKGFFDAHRPEFRDYIVKLMLEAIERYDVDGINLDYIRTGGICQGPKCQAEYKAKYGTELADDMKLRDDSGNTIDRVIEWQDEAISDIVARVAEGGRKLRPELIVSIDGHVHPPTSAPGTQGRNELPWIEAGWVDVVYNMDYGEHLGFETVNAVRAATGKPQAIVDLPGNYTRDDAGSVIPRDAQLVADHISYCQRRWPGNGVGLYLYSMLSDEQIDALRAGPFEEDAVPHWIR